MNWSIIGEGLAYATAGVFAFSCVCFLVCIYKLNTYKLPLSCFVFRSSAMLLYSLVVWVPLSAAALFAIHNTLPIPSKYFSLSCFFLGALLPTLTFLTYIPFNPTRKEKVTDTLPGPLGSLFLVREVTTGYVKKIIERQVRSEIEKYLPNEANYVAKAFEFHILAIAERESKLDKYGDPRNILKIKDPYSKNWYLLRYLGYSRWAFLLGELKQNSGIIFPSWPDDLPDRRYLLTRRTEDDPQQVSTQRREKPYGRRKTDMPYTQHFILRNRIN